MAWFELSPTGNPTQPNDYTFSSNEPSCLGEDQICAVQANPDSNNKPQLTDALKNQMIEALHDRTPSANVKLRNS